MALATGGIDTPLPKSKEGGRDFWGRDRMHTLPVSELLQNSIGHTRTHSAGGSTTSLVKHMSSSSCTPLSLWVHFRFNNVSLLL